MIQFLLLVSRQGKVRLSKWYVTVPAKEKAKLTRAICQLALTRSARLANVVELQGRKYVCRRYASLHFIACIDDDDNELMTLELIHHFVEVLDRYFGNVCELDLIFNFHRVYFILDEVVLAGEPLSSNKSEILQRIRAHDAAAEESEEAAAGSGSTTSAVVSQVAQALRNI